MPGQPPDDAVRQVRNFVSGFTERYMRTAIVQLPASSLRDSLLTLLNEAEGDLGRLKESIEIWFNNAMDRVGGWYKRRTNLVVMILATIVTLGLNVDTLLIMQTLQSQAAIRDAIVGKAKTMSEHLPTAMSGGPDGVLASDNGQRQRDATQASSALFGGDELQSLHAQIEALSLPIGWFRPAGAAADCGAVAIAANRIECTRAANHQLLAWMDPRISGWSVALWGDVAFHGAGWLLTIIAASLGAPFWFDILNKFITIRSVGRSARRRAETTEEGAPASRAW